MVTLENVNPAALAVDLGQAVRPALGILDERREREKRQKTIDEALGDILGTGAPVQPQPETQIPGAISEAGATPQGRDREQEQSEQELSRLNELAPDLGALLTQTEDPQQLKRIQDDALVGMSQADSVLAQPDLISKRQELTKIAQEKVTAGENTERILELANLPEDQLDLELRKMQVIGTDVDSLVNKDAQQRALQEQQAQQQQVQRQQRQLAGIARLATVDPQAAQVIQDQLGIGGAGGAGEFKKSPGVIIDTGEVDAQGNKVFAQSIPVLNDATGEFEERIVPISGDIISRQFGETAQQFQQRQITTAGGQSAATQAAETAAIPGRKAALSVEERIDKNIDDAFIAADVLPTINRGLELLNDVETGGFASLGLRAKQALGIENANEAELAQATRKAVLSQLRATFGAAFTENEGRRLEAIEASTDKSTAGNKRLLTQAQRILDRAVKRGARDARRRGDEQTALDIEEAAAFSLNPPDEGAEGDVEINTKPAVEQTDDELLKSF